MCHSLFLVKHNVDMSFNTAALILVAGYIAICINYEADRQRAHARATGGNCIIWGAKPRMIAASYTTEKGETKHSLLLASGWWSVSRHFHYLPELTAAFCWSLPCGFNSFLPFFYFVFLTPLLMDRGECATGCRWRGGAGRGGPAHTLTPRPQRVPVSE